MALKKYLMVSINGFIDSFGVMGKEKTIKFNKKK